jgi:hypothetical protein
MNCGAVWLTAFSLDRVGSYMIFIISTSLSVHGFGINWCSESEVRNLRGD